MQFNNTLAPYTTCNNANINEKGHRGIWYTEHWADIYLQNARERLAKEIKGYDLTIEDMYIMQQLCAYEVNYPCVFYHDLIHALQTVAIGYSKFCELFTEEEWEGFDYA